MLATFGRINLYVCGVLAVVATSVRGPRFGLAYVLFRGLQCTTLDRLDTALSVLLQTMAACTGHGVMRAQPPCLLPSGVV